jgi:hypothetical protein
MYTAQTNIKYANIEETGTRESERERAAPSSSEGTAHERPNDQSTPFFDNEDCLHRPLCKAAYSLVARGLHSGLVNCGNLGGTDE